jgi:uncharacterized protein YjlB
MAAGHVPLQYVLRETAVFPSSPLPVLVYRAALAKAEADVLRTKARRPISLSSGPTRLAPGPTCNTASLASDQRVQALGLPIADPLQGPAGPLSVLWKSVRRARSAEPGR